MATPGNRDLRPTENYNNSYNLLFQMYVLYSVENVGFRSQQIYELHMVKN